MMFRRKLFYCTLGLVLTLPFQNCGVESSHQQYNQFASKACEGVIAEAYQKTYYSTFRSSCTNCHDSGGSAGRPFASSNFSEALASFISVGRAKIEANAINPGHKPPNTGAQHVAMINAAQATWAEADLAVQNCGGDQAAVETVQKSLPSNVYTTTPSNNATWPLLVFNLTTELSGSSNPSFPVNVQVSLEIRRYRVNSVDMGYEVRNPKARVVGTDLTQKYRIAGIDIVKNGELMKDFTFFSEIDYVFTGGTDTLLQAGGNFAAITPLGAISNADKIGLRIRNMETGSQLVVTDTGSSGGTPGGTGGTVNIPSRITHSNLLSTDPILGVFNRYCVNCHRAGNKSGGLDLTDYTSAFNARSLVRTRMTSANNPMPPSGLIQDSGVSVQVIDVWLSSGAPQN